jgi:hypothetical protein
MYPNSGANTGTNFLTSSPHSIVRLEDCLPYVGLHRRLVRNLEAISIPDRPSFAAEFLQHRLA